MVRGGCDLDNAGVKCQHPSVGFEKERRRPHLSLSAEPRPSLRNGELAPNGLVRVSGKLDPACDGFVILKGSLVVFLGGGFELGGGECAGETGVGGWTRHG